MTQPPTASGRNNSVTDMSKDSAAIASIDSPPARPGSRTSPRSRSSSAWWETTTPFGRPVEPEV